jgi:hypothetical protein
MNYVLYSTPVKVRSGRELMIPPISMYHLRKMLELKDQGVNLDEPDAVGMGKLMSLFVEIIQENHPDLTLEQFEKEVDAHILQEVVAAVQGTPKNSMPQIGMTTPVEEAPTETKMS